MDSNQIISLISLFVSGFSLWYTWRNYKRFLKESAEFKRQYEIFKEKDLLFMQSIERIEGFLVI